MTALKVKDLPQEQREQLLNEAKEKGININFCMGWTVDTLKDKIAATVAKNENGDEAKAEETPAEETKADEAKAPANTQKAYICHICRSKVIDGKCTGCGYSLR